MSMFLGPIHYLMFTKIKIAASRSKTVIKLFTDKFGKDAEEVINASLPDGPVDFGNNDLEELLGDNPIHQFLQGLIDKVEMAEGTLVTALLYRFPDDSREMLNDAFRKNGEEVSKRLESNNTEQTVQDIGNSLSQVYLEGMPCDQVSSFDVKDEKTIHVNHSDCLHLSKWESTGAPPDIMCELLDSWVLGFAKGLNPKVNIERLSSSVKGQDSCTCSISV